MTVVYVDTLFLLNLTIDYLLLRLSARVCGQHIPTCRLALGALVGAGYALCAFLPKGGFLTEPLVKMTIGVLLALIAFGGRRRFLRLTVVFFACACALGGGVLMVSLLGQGSLTYANGIPATGLDFKLLCLSAAGSYLVLSVGTRCLGRYSKLTQEILPVRLTLQGRTVYLDALVDTGNTLADPLSDARVLVAEWEAARPLFPADLPIEAALEAPTEQAAALAEAFGAERVRLIPYRSVGVSNGMLFAIRVDGAIINGKTEPRLLVALCPGKLSVHGNYTALIGAEE